MNSREKKEAKEYLKEMGEVTLPAFREKMSMPEKMAKDLLWELVGEGVLENSVGFVFRYVGQGNEDAIEKRKTLYEDLCDEESELFSASNRREPDDFWDWENDEKDDDKKSVSPKKPIQNEELPPSSDKKEDGDGSIRKIEEIAQDVLKKLPPETEALDEDAVDVNALGGNELEKRRTLAKVATSFGCSGKFIARGGVYYCDVGVSYPDDTEWKFKLSNKDKIVLSDCGLTYKFLTKYYNIEGEKVQKQIKRILTDYSLKVTMEDLAICIQIRDAESAFVSFLWLFSAIERILGVVSDNLLCEVANDVAVFCKEEIIKIVFTQEASYEEAKKIAADLYAQASAGDDEFKKQAYTNILSTFSLLTEDCYEQFKREIRGE